MSQVHANRAPQPAPRPATAHLGAAVLASAPPINNKSNSRSGDPLGNATSSLLVYMFEVLPGRMTARLAPARSDAQSQTPQLMASVHAQDAAAAQQKSWDSAFWRGAGDAFAMAFDGIRNVAEFVARHARLPHVGPTGAEAATVAGSIQTLSELQTLLSSDFRLEKSAALLQYEAEGGDSAEGLVVFLPDPDHADVNLQRRVDGAVHLLLQINRGDRVMKEFVGGQITSKERMAAVCGVPAEGCTLFEEPASVNEALRMAAQTRDAAVELLQWTMPHLTRSQGETLVKSLKDVDMTKTASLAHLVNAVNAYCPKVGETVHKEMKVRMRAFGQIVRTYESTVDASSTGRSMAYLTQVNHLRSTLPKRANLLVTCGSAHVDDFRDRVLKDPTRRHIIANLRTRKVDL